MKHFFELGQKIKLDKGGIFKVGLSSKGTFDVAGATAALAEKARVLFQPETESVFKESVSVTRAVMVDGTPTEVQSTMPVYTHPATMLKDIRFELAQDSIGSGIEPSGGGTTPDSGGDDEPRP
jgi:hypothetical protein